MNELNCDFEILYTLDIDNTGRQSQKEINKIKKSLIKKYNALNEDNDSKLLCNAMLNNAIKKFRKVYKDNYNTVIATICKMLPGEINNCMYDIWKKHNLYKLENGDRVYIYYNGIKYVYELVNKYDEVKDGTIVVHRNNEDTVLTLITCKHNTNKQLVFIIELNEIIQEEK